MKTKLLGLTTALFCLVVGVSAQAQTPRRLTMTLLPAKESAGNQQDLLWIQNNPVKDVYLQFDLRSLPPDLTRADIVRCTLRLRAEDVTYQPVDNPDSGAQLVIVKGQLANDDFTAVANTQDIASLSTLLDTPSKQNSVALQASDALAEAVYREYAGDKTISFRLHSDSHKASSLFYSSKNFGDTPSHKPRLVIEYTPRSQSLLESASWSQHQQNPEHTGRSPWAPFRAPNSFSLVTVPLPKIGENVGAVVDYPLIYQGNLYLVSKVLDQNYLLSLNFKGAERWRRAIGEDTVQRSPVISRNGILYVAMEKQIAGYDLTQSGKDYASFPLSGNKLSAYTGLTQGNDGSLFLALAENAVNYVYGFTPSLNPFLKSEPLGSGREKISTVTVSPDGRKIFAQTPKGGVVIDVANPSEQRTIPLVNGKDEPWEYYYAPVSGPTGDTLIFADFTSKANKGNIWGYSETEIIWNASGSLTPQPVLGVNGRVYYLQDGALHGHSYDQRGPAAITAGAGLNTTSNLVMDGADNLYFWDNGYLHGYSPQAERLFEKVNFVKQGLEEQRPADPESVSTEKKTERSKDSSGPEQFIRLMMGPDGTLWANNKNGNVLYAFKPSYASADLTVQQTDIKPQTAYRATGKLTVDGVTVSGGTQIILQAQNGVGFARGFKVQKGASLVARTGF